MEIQARPVVQGRGYTKAVPSGLRQAGTLYLARLGRLARIPRRPLPAQPACSFPVDIRADKVSVPSLASNLFFYHRKLSDTAVITKYQILKFQILPRYLFGRYDKQQRALLLFVL